MAQDTQVMELLAALRGGEAKAMDRLFPLVYDELHSLARRQARRMGSDQTLDTTALLHEAYLELSDRSQVDWNDRAHFVAVAATVMRHLLIDHAREKATLKRGGHLHRTALDDLSLAAPAPTEDLLALDEALGRIGELDQRMVHLVEMRFFGGLTEAEIAGVLQVSERTVKRDWRKAKALLYAMLREEPAG